MFDTFMGLPVHVLVLHAAVILLPISAAATAAVFGRPVWRQAYGTRLVAVNVGMLALTFVTVQAGQQLQDRFQRIGDTAVPRDDHEAFGRTLLWIMLALTVATVLAVLAERQGAPASVGTALGVVVAGLAAASIVFTVITGHTGSKSHWEDFVDNTGAMSSAEGR